MPRGTLAHLPRFVVVRSFFVRALKLALILTPTEQKAIVLLLCLFVLGCFFKFVIRSL